MNKYKLKINNKLEVNKLLESYGFKARWQDDYLLIAYRNYDRIIDILTDNNIEYN